MLFVIAAESKQPALSLAEAICQRVYPMLLRPAPQLALVLLHDDLAAGGSKFLVGGDGDADPLAV